MGLLTALTKSHSMEKMRKTSKKLVGIDPCFTERMWAEESHINKTENYINWEGVFLTRKYGSVMLFIVVRLPPALSMKKPCLCLPWITFLISTSHEQYQHFSPTAYTGSSDRYTPTLEPWSVQPLFHWALTLFTDALFQK